MPASDSPHTPATTVAHCSSLHVFLGDAAAGGAVDVAITAEVDSFGLLLVVVAVAAAAAAVVVSAANIVAELVPDAIVGAVVNAPREAVLVLTLGVGATVACLYRVWLHACACMSA